MVKQCGPKLALVIPDARTERTKPQVTTCDRDSAQNTCPFLVSEEFGACLTKHLIVKAYPVVNKLLCFILQKCFVPLLTYSCINRLGA